VLRGRLECLGRGENANAFLIGLLARAGEKTRSLAETMNDERNSERLQRSLLDMADECAKLAETEAQERDAD